MQKIGPDVKVTKEDQTLINNFSKLYQRRQDLDDVLVKLKEKINQHQDTIDEIEFTDDDEILKYRFGSCFFHLPSTLRFIQPTRSVNSSTRISRKSRRSSVALRKTTMMWRSE